MTRKRFSEDHRKERDDGFRRSSPKVVEQNDSVAVHVPKLQNAEPPRPPRPLSVPRGSDPSSGERFLKAIAAERPYLLAAAQRRKVAEPEDLVQLVIEKAIKGQAQFTPGTNLRAWLTKILIRTFLDDLKKAYRHREVLSSEIEQPVEAFEAAPWWAELDREAIESAGARIPPPLYEIFGLYHFQGMSYAGISKKLGIPSGTVGSKLFRAREAIKRQLLSARASTLQTGEPE